MGAEFLFACLAHHICSNIVAAHASAIPTHSQVYCNSLFNIITSYCCTNISTTCAYFVDILLEIARCDALKLKFLGTKSLFFKQTAIDINAGNLLRCISLRIWNITKLTHRMSIKSEVIKLLLCKKSTFEEEWFNKKHKCFNIYS